MKKLINKILGLDSGTRKRAIASIVTFAVNALAVFGGIEIADEKVDLIIKGLVAVVTAVVWILGFYFNEQYTEEGCEGTGYTRARKAGLKDPEELIEDGYREIEEDVVGGEDNEL